MVCKILMVYYLMIKKCVHEIHDGEEIHSKVDISESDLTEGGF